MGKDGRCDKSGLKKGAWSEDEDNKLKAYIQRYGHWNWALLPKFAGVSRSGKSCRLRWMNYLRPNMKHGNFTKEEDDLIVDLHNELGNKWSRIAEKLPGRSDNEIKNRWNTQLKKRAQDGQTVSESEHIRTLEPDQANQKANPVNETYLQLQQQDEMLFPAPTVPSESSSSPSTTELLSCWLTDNESCEVSSEVPPRTFDDDMVGNFWTEPYLPENDNIISLGDNLWSPYNFVNDFIPQYSCQDTMMTDDFLWSTFDTYVEDNM